MRFAVDLFTSAPDSSLLYAGTYDPLLVGSSVVIAVFASYAALLVCEQIASASKRHEGLRWLGLGGLCMGLGIWAMHFVGMLALTLPCATNYDSWTTVLSVVPSLLACTWALHLISGESISQKQLITGGFLLGLGICAMHFTGMAALHLNGIVRYDLRLVIFSVIVAAGVATLAIWIKFRLAREKGWLKSWSKVISAAVLGLAISAMHYTAMSAAYFLREGDTAIPDSQLSPIFLASIVLAAIGVVIVATLVSLYLARPKTLPTLSAYTAIFFMMAVWVLVAWISSGRYFDNRMSDVYQQELQRATEQSEVVSQNINDDLALLKSLSIVTSQDSEVLKALSVDKKTKSGFGLVKLNESLAISAKNLRADVIWLMDLGGDCIASSNADQADSFVGSNFAFREYFKGAKLGNLSEQYAVGSVSGVPGIYFSTPVKANGTVIGVVVVKGNINNLFRRWGQVGSFLTGPDNTIVTGPENWQPSLGMAGPSWALLLDGLRDIQRNKRVVSLALAPQVTGSLIHGVVQIDAIEEPLLHIARPAVNGNLVLHLTQPIRNKLDFAGQRTGLFILLVAAGGMLILGASTTIAYLRETRLTASELRVAATAFETYQGMLIADDLGMVLRCNAAFCEITGLKAPDVIGQFLFHIAASQQISTFWDAALRDAQNHGHWQGEVLNRRQSGESYPASMSITAVRQSDNKITNYVVVHTDVSARRATEVEIQNLAFFDPLTSLPNRRLMQDRLDQALLLFERSRKQGAVMFIDLDNFKTLNDTQGHGQGDVLLRVVAQRLTVCMRECDTVARFGGDEFVVMLEDLSANPKDAVLEAQVVAEKIRSVLAFSHDFGTGVQLISASIGVTLFLEPEDSADDVLRRADLAMYQSKAKGGDTLTFYDPDLQAEVMLRASLEADIRVALQERQFLLHYQPQVDKTGRIYGVEALVRWMHPERGLISPGYFIPLAEKSGLILPLGKWIFETACAQQLSWSREPETSHLSVSVNVSARQFRSVDFVDYLRQSLEKSGADAKRIKLEITESLLFDAEDTIDKIEALQALGLRFSLDDFGTGFSSLSYLKRLPLDQLKIDQSFVKDICTDAADAAIVKTIITLGDSLKMVVIAEGVETREQRDFLEVLGCCFYQGYYFGKPVPAGELTRQLVSPMETDRIGHS